MFLNYINSFVFILTNLVYVNIHDITCIITYMILFLYVQKMYLFCIVWNLVDFSIPTVQSFTSIKRTFNIF